MAILVPVHVLWIFILFLVNAIMIVPTVICDSFDIPADLVDVRIDCSACGTIVDAKNIPQFSAVEKGFDLTDFAAKLWHQHIREIHHELPT